MSKQIVKTNNIKNNKIKQKSPFTLKRNQFLIEQAKKSENECLQSLNTTTEGLKINEIEERREKYGYNAISTTRMFKGDINGQETFHIRICNRRTS